MWVTPLVATYRTCGFYCYGAFETSYLDAVKYDFSSESLIIFYLLRSEDLKDNDPAGIPTQSLADRR